MSGGTFLALQSQGKGLGQLEGGWQGAEPSLVGSRPVRPSSQTGFEAVAATG